MTVYQLIQYLSKYPADTPVRVAHDGAFTPDVQFSEVGDEIGEGKRKRRLVSYVALEPQE